MSGAWDGKLSELMADDPVEPVLDDEQLNEQELMAMFNAH